MPRQILQKTLKNLVFTLCVTALLCILCSCGRQDTGFHTSSEHTQQTGQEEWPEEEAKAQNQADPDDQSQEPDDPGSPAQDQETMPEFCSVPFFRDSTGGNTQAYDGWIYGYWDRQLIRVNAATLKSEILYETKSPQHSFCLHEGCIYFLEEKQIDYPDLRTGHKADLRSIKCDGSDPRLLASDVDLTDIWYCRMNVYDDILYLTSPSSSLEAYHFFRLLEDGSVQEISGDETLYGTLPQGYKEACSQYQYYALPNLPAGMTYLGYVFLKDESNRLYRFSPRSGQKEEIPFPAGNGYQKLFLTNQALVYEQEGSWYSMSLDNTAEITRIGTLDCQNISFWDEKGIYSAAWKSEEGAYRLTRLGWDGERKILHYAINAPSPDTLCNILYSDGSWLYYSRLDNGDDAAYRIPLEGDGEAERFYVYYDNPLKDISIRETFDTTFTVENSKLKCCFSLTKVTLTEQTKAAERINAFLQKEYDSQEAYLEDLMADVRDISSTDGQEIFSSSTLSDCNMSTSIGYLDEHYISFCMGWYQYNQGAAHGGYSSTLYVFDRATGSRLQITDVVNNPPSEICSIIAPYVKAGSDWGTDEEGWESIILEDGRFYLTAEGIGIHFDVYEMTCYAAGALDVVIPYEKFDLREPVTDI